MSRNYYVTTKDNKRYHIGKTAMGWKFIFEAQVPLDLFSKGQWADYLFLNQSKTVITDEYDNKLTFDQFFKIVNNYLETDVNMKEDLDVYTDRYGFSNCLYEFE